MKTMIMPHKCLILNLNLVVNTVMLQFFQTIRAGKND